VTGHLAEAEEAGDEAGVGEEEVAGEVAVVEVIANLGRMTANRATRNVWMQWTPSLPSHQPPYHHGPHPQRPSHRPAKFKTNPCGGAPPLQLPPPSTHTLFQTPSSKQFRKKIPELIDEDYRSPVVAMSTLAPRNPALSTSPGTFVTAP